MMRLRSTLILPLIACLALSATTTVAAQDAEADEADPSLWIPTVIGKLAGSQAGFQNWAEGGVNTLAFSVGLDGKAERTKSSWRQIHEGRLSFGLVKQDTLDFRKAEDLIRLSSTFTYTGSGFLDKLKPTVALLARTQFAPGFNFEKNPFKDGRTPPVKVSDFLSPGTFTQSLGMTYQPKPYLSQRFGLGGKQTVVLLEDLRTLYNVDVDKNVRLEMGMEAFTNFNKELVKNVVLKSTVGLFAAFNKPESPDLIWESQLNMKVNSWLNVNFDWAVLFDEDVSDRAQMKEVFSIGFSYIFI